jgi:HSP20 family protein
MSTCCNPSTSTVQTPAQTSAVKPRFRVQNSADSYSVQVELPGVKKENVSVNLDQNILSVSGTRSTTVPADWKPLYRELCDVNYQLRLKLNVPVEDSKLSAKLEDGVLTLSLPVKEAAKPRTIAVS